MSLKQIAEMVGTSPSTVSRVLNMKSPSCASAELKEKIWAAAQETGYHPDENARALQAGGKQAGKEEKPLRIYVLFSRYKGLESDPFFDHLLRCLQTELYRQGMRSGGVLYGEEDLEKASAEADGVIALGRCSKELLRRVQKQNRNVVGIWRNPMDFQVDEVICDGKKAAALAIEHLISLGHRQIAYIGDCSFEDRYVGYTNTLIQHGIPINYHLVAETDQTYGEGQAAINALLDKKDEDPFTAVFCANDITASGVQDVLRTKKVRPKERISVISIDDIEELCGREPYLTTIHIPRQEMAHMAVQLLLDRIHRQHRENVRIEFPCRIIQRDSCYRVS